nr:VOC family protein [uncultured Tolumonas sp.]
MATIQWDHSVHYVNDLDLAIQTFAENGLRAFRGGSHKQWRTHNALSYFGLTYHEFLSIENRELAEQTEHNNHVVQDAVKALPEHEVLSRVALRTDDIEAVAASLKAQGLDVAPIIDGKRLNQQGQLIEWQMLTIGGHFSGLRYPFVIQWKGTDAERLLALKESGVLQPHPAGDVQLEQAVFTVSDPKSVAQHWHQLFGFPIIIESDEGVTLAVADKTFLFQQGDAEALTQLRFKTESAALKGKTVTIGEGEYYFYGRE